MSSEEFNVLIKDLWAQRCNAIGEIALKICTTMIGREATLDDVKRCNLVRNGFKGNTRFDFDGQPVGLIEEEFDGFKYSLRFTPLNQ